MLLELSMMYATGPAPVLTPKKLGFASQVPNAECARWNRCWCTRLTSISKGTFIGNLFSRWFLRRFWLRRWQLFGRLQVLGFQNQSRKNRWLQVLDLLSHHHLEFDCQVVDRPLRWCRRLPDRHRCPNELHCFFRLFPRNSFPALPKSITE